MIDDDDDDDSEQPDMLWSDMPNCAIETPLHKSGTEKEKKKSVIKRG